MPDAPKPPPATGGKKVAGINTKWWVIGGAATVGIVWYSMHKAKASAAASTSSTVDTSQIDPATGIPYSQEYAYDSGYSAAPSYGGGGGGGGYVDTSGAGQPTTTTLDGSTALPNSMQAWLLEAESYLLAAGYDPNLIASTLGNIGSGQPLTGTQQGVAGSAAGAVGSPPPTTSSSPSQPVDSSPAPQPQPAPAPAPAPLPTMTAPSLSGSATADHKADFRWSAVPGAKGYDVFLNGVYHLYYSAGHEYFESAAHAKGYKYGPITVKAVRAADGALGPASNAVTVTIK